MFSSNACYDPQVMHRVRSVVVLPANIGALSPSHS